MISDLFYSSSSSNPIYENVRVLYEAA
jgi:hypothetical protein